MALLNAAVETLTVSACKQCDFFIIFGVSNQRQLCSEANKHDDFFCATDMIKFEPSVWIRLGMILANHAWQKRGSDFFLNP